MSPAFLGPFAIAALALALPLPARADPPTRGGEQRARVDRQGDPLPPGAVARFGTLRLRHANGVNGLAFSPDGRVLATAGGMNPSWDNVVRLWDTRDGRELRNLGGKAGSTRAVAFSADGKRIAAVVRGGAQVWDAATGKQVQWIAGRWGLNSLALSPDGKRIAAGANHELFVWDLVSGKLLFARRGHQGDVRVAFAGEGKLLISVGQHDNKLHFWDASSGQEVRTVIVPSREGAEGGYCLAVSPDGKLLATGHFEAIHLWETVTGREVRVLKGHSESIGGLAFAPDGKRLLSSGFDGTVRMWDVATGKQLARYPGCDGGFQPVAFAPDGKTFASTGKDGQVRLRKTDTGEDAMPLPGHRGPVYWSALTPDGQTLITGGQDQTIRVWKTAMGEEQRRLEVRHYYGARHGLLARDGRTLATADGTMVRLWDAASGELLQQLPPQGNVSSLALAPNGRLLAIAHRPIIEGAWKDLIRLWDLARGREGLQLNAGKHEVKAVAFAPDSKHLATGGVHGCVQLWDAGSGKQRWEIVATPQEVALALAFSPDGQLLATADRDGRIRLLDAASGKEARQWKARSGCLCSLAFSPDGKLLATANGYLQGVSRAHHGNRDIVVWEVATGTALRTFDGHAAGVNHVAFTPDGRGVVSASHDTTTLVWGLLPPPGQGTTPREPERLWEELASDKPPTVYQAIWSLAAAPAVALPLFERHLQPAAGDKPPGPRELRAVQVLELMASPEAEKWLAALAEGGPAAALTTEAQAALARLKARRAPVARVELPKGGIPERGPRVLQDHDGEVLALAFAPDGTRLASGGEDGRLTIGELAGGKVVLDRKAHDDGVLAAAFAPDGKLLASGGDRRIRLWDTAAGKELRVLEGHGDKVAALAFSADGKRLASGGYDGKVRLWELPAARLLREWRASPGRVTSLAFAPDGKQLLSGGAEKVVAGGVGMAVADSVVLWDVSTGQKRRTFPSRGSTVAFTPDGRLIVAGGLVPDTQDRGGGIGVDSFDLIALWRADTGEEELRIPWRGGAVALSPDGRLIASGAGSWFHLHNLQGGNLIANNGINGRNHEPSLRLWELHSGRQLLRWPESAATRLAFSPDSRTLVAATQAGVVLAWDLVREGADPRRKDLEALWADLTSEDAVNAWRATCTLSRAGDRAVALIAKRLPAAAAPDAERVRKLIADLGGDQFAVREAASRELHLLGPAIEPAVRRALEAAPPPEVRKRLDEIVAGWRETRMPLGELGRLRALRALEQIGTPAARQTLKALAEGAPEARLTREAKAALDRLARVPAAQE